MKSVLYRTAALAVELFTALAACVGCSKQHAEKPEPAKPSQIHWHGPATGYDGTTEPVDQSNPAKP